MSNIDSATWQALGLVLTLVGLAVSARVWKRRGAARGLRAVAWSLLPLAAGLTGTLRLAADIAGAVEGWATRLVFSPVVWSGVALAGVSLGLFAASGWLLRRPDGGSEEPKQVRGAKAPRQVSAHGAEDLDLDEIEQILRRRGIS